MATNCEYPGRWSQDQYLQRNRINHRSALLLPDMISPIGNRSCVLVDQSRRLLGIVLAADAVHRGSSGFAPHCYESIDIGADLQSEGMLGPRLNPKTGTKGGIS